MEQNFGLFSENKFPDTYAHVALMGNTEPNLLAKLFFSRKNMQIIQHKVMKDIYERSKNIYKPDYQPETELLIIMRSVYLTYSKNLPNDITKQIAELNEISYQKVVEKVYPQLLSYIAYLRDASQMYTPMEVPKNVSSTGTGNKLLPGPAVALFDTKTDNTDYEIY
jgi:hypothetical protein